MASLRRDGLDQTTARKAPATLSRAALTATAAVLPAANVCASADLFRFSGCSKGTASISTTEKRVPLFQPIERGGQLRDGCIGLIGDDDSSILIFLYSIGIPPAFTFYAPNPKHTLAVE